MAVRQVQFSQTDAVNQNIIFYRLLVLDESAYRQDDIKKNKEVNKIIKIRKNYKREKMTTIKTKENNV